MSAATFSYKKGPVKRVVVDAVDSSAALAAAPASAKRVKIDADVAVPAPGGDITFPSVPLPAGDGLLSRSSRGLIYQSSLQHFIEDLVQRHISAASGAAHGGKSAAAAVDAAKAAANAFATAARDCIASHSSMADDVNPKNAENRVRIEDLKRQIVTCVSSHYLW